MIDIASLVYGPVFATWGVGATYIPAAGAPIPCTVLWSHGDRDFAIHGIGITSPSRLADLRVTEVAEAKEGDRLEIEGATYPITKASIPDGNRLVWKLELGSPL